MDNSLKKKLQSLLRVNTERGASQSEMETALAMAQKLAYKHRVSLDDIVVEEAEPKEELIEKTFLTSMGERKPPQNNYICLLLQRYFGVKVILLDGTKVSFIGRKSDVEFAQYVYAYLRGEFLRLWYIERWEQDLKVSSRNSFFQGLYASLNNKLHVTMGETEQEVQKELGVNSERLQIVLVSEKDLINQKAKELHPYLTKTRVDFNRNSHDLGAMAAGIEKGKKIQINKALK